MSFISEITNRSVLTFTLSHDHFLVRPSSFRTSRSTRNDCLVHCFGCIRSCKRRLHGCCPILCRLMYACFFFRRHDDLTQANLCDYIGGRRTTMIAGGLVTAICMLTIGSLYATEASSTDGGRWSIIVLIYIFIVGYSSSWAIVTRIICSEIQPMRTRAAATSLGQCANWVSKIVLVVFRFRTEY